jgi:acetyl-CoA carboxylase carboxyl transferase subunit alpha
VRRVAEENGVDVREQIGELETRAAELRRETYSRLTPVQQLQVARHPNRPTFLDIALNITDKWVELHGDRGGYDDPAMVCGVGVMEGETFMFIGHQKGRNTKENLERNFGMPTPAGYRKALRMMRHAERFGFPVLTFVDTPGAYAGVKAEEMGQGEAIAYNLRESFGIKVPIISLVIGEGGSGGALAIGICDKMLMMEHSVYYVASPEACAAILWKTRDATPKATEALRITSSELLKMGVCDAVVPEPEGAAHADPLGAFDFVKTELLATIREFKSYSTDELLEHRYNKFRKLGVYNIETVDGESLPLPADPHTATPESYAAEIAGKQVGAGVEVDVNEASADPSSIAMQQ